MGYLLIYTVPSVRGRVKEAYHNCLGARAHEWYSDDDEDDEDNYED